MTSQTQASSGTLSKFFSFNRYIAACLAIYALLIIVYVSGYSAFWAYQLDFYYFELIFLGLLIFLLGRSALKATNRAIRSFWWMLVLGFGFWFAIRMTYWIQPDSALANSELYEDTLLLLHSAAIAIAIELRFDLYADRFWLQRRSVYAIGALLFVYSTFAYFGIMPLISTGEPYVSPFLLYAAIDSYLAIRFITATIQARNLSWRLLYAGFSVAFLLIILADTLSWQYRLENINYQPGQWMNLGWYLWYPVAMLATGIKPVDLDIARSEVNPNHLNPAINGLLVYGLAMPFIHAIGYGTESFNDEIRHTRELFVSAWIVVVAGLLFGIYHVIRRSVDKVDDERQRAEDNARQYARQLDRELRTRSLGRLSAGLAHDFGNTVLAIASNLKALETKTSNGAPIDREIDGLNQSVRYAQDLVTKLSALGGSGKQSILESLDLNDELTRTFEVLKPSIRENITLNVQTPEHPVSVDVEKSMVHQVITNYVYNAIDAIENEGQIDVSVEASISSASCASCGESLGDGFAAITVSDNGIGIDESIEIDIFEPLVSSKPVGAGGGLGLSTVDSLMHKIGGHVGFRRRPEGGTSFSVYFVKSA